MLYLKSCLKCKGDVYLGDDMYGSYMTCLQCGFAYDAPANRRAIAFRRLQARPRPEIAYADRKAS